MTFCFYNTNVTFHCLVIEGLDSFFRKEQISHAVGHHDGKGYKSSSFQELMDIDDVKHEEAGAVIIIIVVMTIVNWEERTVLCSYVKQ